MNREPDDRSIQRLRLAVASWAAMGLIGIPLFVLFDVFGGWRWEPHNPIYDQMIVSIYAAVGLCALMALRNPLAHASFLWFVVWSSVLHGGVMLFHALHDSRHAGHLVGDVWILAGAIGLAIPLWQARQFDDCAARGVEPAREGERHDRFPR